MPANRVERRWRTTHWEVALSAALLWSCTAPAQRASLAAPTQESTPHAQARPHRIESPAGTRDDEFYWLRDDARSAPEVLAYIAAENAYTEARLAPLKASEELLFREIVTRIPQEDASPPVRDHGYLYSTRFVAGGEYPVHTRRRDQAGAPEQVLLDGNELAKGHGYYRIGGYEVSSDERVLAWAEDIVGRGQYRIRFKDLESGALLADAIENVEPSLAWAEGDLTLLYIEKDPDTLLGSRVRKHRLGTRAADDALVYEERDHAFYLSVWKSRSRRYLSLSAQSTVSSEQWLTRADDPALAFRVLVPRARDHEYLAEDFGDQLVLRSNEGAPNFRIVSAPLAEPARRERWRELVPEPRAGLVEDLAVFRDFLAYAARADGVLRVYVRVWRDGRVQRIELPETSSTARLDDNREVESDRVRFAYTSLTTPDSIYDYHVASGERTLLKRDPVIGGFHSEDYASERLQVKAHDGALVPVSLVYRKGVARDGRAPLFQFGYGSYGASEDPEFDRARLSLLDRGVVFAIAHVRGGQELGRAWYDQGRLLHKRNTFTDFIDVTDALVAQGYAARDRVVARGASAGGLLMGAVANLAPEKYRAIVADVPFVDVVTTMLDPTIPLTTNEFDEWGDPRQTVYYQYMLSYSPYDNVRAQAYPALFVTTGLWDSQVQYYEPLKWVARLRARKTDAHPLLLRINMEAGHGGRSGRFVHQEQLAQEYAFLLDQLRIPVRPLARE